VVPPSLASRAWANCALKLSLVFRINNLPDRATIEVGRRVDVAAKGTLQ
jgi:hypothetical protein